MFSAKSNRYSKKEVQELITRKLSSEYILQSDYKNNHTKIEVFHKKCGNIWFTTYRNIKAGNRCPFCTVLSKGEERILNFLNENKISTVYQKRFDDCRRKDPLPFDFYIPDKNILIEYDGVFHYNSIYGEDALTQQKENDEIKNQYCKSKNIQLIRIPYWDFDNIEKILEKELVNYN